MINCSPGVWTERRECVYVITWRPTRPRRVCGKKKKEVEEGIWWKTMVQPNCCGAPRFVHSSASRLFWGPVSSSADMPGCSTSTQIAAPAFPLIHQFTAFQFGFAPGSPRHVCARKQESSPRYGCNVSSGNALVFMEHFPPASHQMHVCVSCDEPPPPLNLLQISLSYTQFVTLQSNHDPIWFIWLGGLFCCCCKNDVKRKWRGCDTDVCFPGEWQLRKNMACRSTKGPGYENAEEKKQRKDKRICFDSKASCLCCSRVQKPKPHINLFTLMVK